MHFADIFDLRLKFSESDGIWKIWIIYLLIFDSIAAIGLWKERLWGVTAFLLISVSQLIAYTLFQDVFGPQWFLVVFHIATLSMFAILGGFKKTTIAILRCRSHLVQKVDER